MPCAHWRASPATISPPYAPSRGAAAAIHEEIPWLKIETPDDLVQFFERHRDYRRHHSRIAEVWWERAV
jgi:hypothetical protein